jgi:hypothetical protein
MYMCVYVCMCVCVYIYIYIYMYTEVMASRDRPRWPKGFRMVKAPDFLDFRH